MEWEARAGYESSSDWREKVREDCALSSRMAEARCEACEEGKEEEGGAGLGDGERDCEPSTDIASRTLDADRAIVRMTGAEAAEPRWPAGDATTFELSSRLWVHWQRRWWCEVL